jgi:hypothetical protein
VKEGPSAVSAGVSSGSGTDTGAVSSGSGMSRDYEVMRRRAESGIRPENGQRLALFRVAN